MIRLHRDRQTVLITAATAGLHFVMGLILYSHGCHIDSAEHASTCMYKSVTRRVNPWKSAGQPLSQAPSGPNSRVSDSSDIHKESSGVTLLDILDRVCDTSQV